VDTGSRWGLGSDFHFIFTDSCQWSPWGPWSPCQVPCSGGFRLRWREAGGLLGRSCREPWAQTESCNMGSCPGNHHPRTQGPKEMCFGKEGAALGAGVSPAQTPTFWSSGESCEAQDTVSTLDCANRCPRSCIDLWDRVQCLQGPCSPGSQLHLAQEFWGYLGPLHCLLLSESV
jgi:hypothetical protein